jgi:hypothetical protein
MKLWIKALAGALAWFASLLFSFAAVPWACSFRSKPLLLAIPLIALAVTAICGWMSYSEWRQVGQEYPGEAGGEAAATRTLASAGVLLNGLFIIVLVAQMIAPGVLGVCE